MECKSASQNMIEINKSIEKQVLNPIMIILLILLKLNIC